MIRSSHQRRDPSQRRGVAAVEVAALLPLYVLLAFGAIETANATYLKRDVTLAAYLAATQLEDRQGTVASSIARAQVLLDARGITGYTITLSDDTGTTITEADAGQTFTFSVTAPVAGNAINLTQIYTNSTVQGSATMIRSY